MRGRAQGHFSAVTDLAVAPGNWSLLSAGRDSVVIMWDLRSFAKLATFPVYEVVEGAAPVRRHAPRSTCCEVLQRARGRPAPSNRHSTWLVLAQQHTGAILGCDQLG